MPLPHKELLADEFWAFSLVFYGKKGVKEICLYWQDNFSANVNLMLFMLWCDHLKIKVSTDDVKHLNQSLLYWNKEYTGKLRDLRRAVTAEKIPASTLDKVKKSLLTAELELEKVEQSILIALIQQNKVTENKQPNNLVTYVSQLVEKPYQAHLAQIRDLNQTLSQL